MRWAVFSHHMGAVMWPSSLSDSEVEAENRLAEAQVLASEALKRLATPHRDQLVSSLFIAQVEQVDDGGSDYY